MKFETLHVFDTKYSADSIEWCPNEKHRAHFVCGTYQLQESSGGDGGGGDAPGNSASANEEGCRKGCMFLFKFDGTTRELLELQRLNTAAILDMKWRPPAPNVVLPMLATANAKGEVDVYELVDCQLLWRSKHKLQNASDGELLALSLDWHLNGELLVSDSKGNISLLNLTDVNVCQMMHTWPAHGYEAWTCAFDRWLPALAYSGGDDSLLRAYDLRANKEVWTNKSHMAGVTSLLSHPRREHMLLTGCYDEQLRMFDTRKMKSPLATIGLDGGIWRIKVHPQRDELLLLACMYKNFSLVKIGTGDVQLSLSGIYREEHDSICYGADWCQADIKLTDNLSYMATCSFYDHKLCVTMVEH